MGALALGALAGGCGSTARHTSAPSAKTVVTTAAAPASPAPAPGATGTVTATTTTTTETQTVSTTNTTPSTVLPAAQLPANHVGSLPVARIRFAAAAAFGKLHGVEMRGTLIKSGQHITLDVAEAGPNEISMEFGSNALQAHIEELPGGVYLKANQAYWVNFGSAQQAAALADRWLALNGVAAHNLAKKFADLQPAALVRCLTVKPAPAQRIVGPVTVNGEPGLRIDVTARHPGEGTGYFDVATHGPPYILAIGRTGNRLPGGPINRCNDGKGDDERGLLTLSHFDDVPHITPPGNALQIAIPPSA